MGDPRVGPAGVPDPSEAAKRPESADFSAFERIKTRRFWTEVVGLEVNDDAHGVAGDVGVDHM